MGALSSSGLPWIQGPPWLAAAVLYLLAGLGVALLLARQGQSLGTVLGACIAWPLLLGLFGTQPRPTAGGGPLARSIAEAFSALEEVLQEHGDAPLPGELGALRAALVAADQRLAVADRILHDPRLAAGGGAVAADLSTLQAARGRAAAELQDVLGGLHRLRIQVGLLALTEIGDEGARAVEQHLRQLHARVRAIEELSSLGPSPLA
ncbi:MAG: hypothetical protein ABIO70_36635 [Pseudomonadota bacterium]